MTMTVWLMLLAGFALLMVGGEVLVKGSVDAAKKLGVSPLVIGLTLVGFGTSAPELVTSVKATWAGSPGIAVGNFVGSNIANVLLILGLSAVVLPVTIGRQALMRDGVAVVLVTLLFIAISFTMPLTPLVGVGFLLLLVAYLGTVFVMEQRSQAAAMAAGHVEDERGDAMSVLLSVGLAIVGMAVVIYGAHLLVESAISIARAYKISEAVIGLTIVAIGTSLPELVTSLIAAFRGQSDLAVGNILGSNLFNLLAIGGATAVLAPTPVEVPQQIAQQDNFVMLGAIVALFVFSWIGSKLNRIEGALLFAGFCAYMWFLVGPTVLANAA
jgi:cation:H+ antiporter